MEQFIFFLLAVLGFSVVALILISLLGSRDRKTMLR